MSIPVKCPGCEHAFAVADRFAGKKGKCPKCGMIFKAEARDAAVDVFPELDEPLAAPAQPVVPAPKRLSARTVEPPPRNPPPPPPPLTDSQAMLLDSVETFPTVPVGKAISPVGFSDPVSDPLGTNPLGAAAPFVSKEPSGSHAFPRRNPAALLIKTAIGIVAAVVVFVVVVVLSSTMGGGLDSNSPSANKNAAVDDDTNDPEAAPPAAVAPGVTPEAPAGAVDLAKFEPFKASVLTLEIKTADGTGKALCFFAAKDGLAITSYHALAKAQTVTAITSKGLRIEVPGTVALDPEHNLALIKIEPTVPMSREPIPLALDGKLAANAAVVAHDASKAGTAFVTGTARGVTLFSKLAPTTRSVLKRLDTATWSDDAQLVQHSVAMSPDSVGAPIFDAQGRAAGMHVMHAESSGGLAVHAVHVQGLVTRATASTTTVRPFQSPMVAVNPMPEPMADPSPLPDPQPPTRPMLDNPVDELIAQIKEGRTAAEKQSWKALDEADYEKLQKLAKDLTVAAVNADNPELAAAEKTKLQEAVQETLASLTDKNWPDDKDWESTNKQAEKSVATAGEAVFALGRVILPPSAGNKLGDKPAAILELTGTGQLVTVVLANESEKFTLDARFLLIGVTGPTTVRLQRGGADLTAPLVQCKYIVAVTTEKAE